MADVLYLLHIVCKGHYQLVVWYVYANINLYKGTYIIDVLVSVTEIS